MQTPSISDVFAPSLHTNWGVELLSLDGGRNMHRAAMFGKHETLILARWMIGHRSTALLCTVWASLGWTGPGKQAFRANLLLARNPVSFIQAPSVPTPSLFLSSTSSPLPFFLPAFQLIRCWTV